MTDHIECVGGPLDGQFVPRNGPELVYSRLPPHQFASAVTETDPSSVLEVIEGIYRTRWWRGTEEVLVYEGER